MATIGIDYVKPGMKLNSDVKDRNGRLLLNAGIEITERHLHIFRTWGITEVDIHGITEEQVVPDPTENVDPQVLRNIDVELNDLFRHNDRHHPAIKELFRFCTLRKIRRLAGKGGQ
ncbi:MAG: hypothetical protein AB1553_03160 [Nitrospirota bacterium]